MIVIALAKLLVVICLVGFAWCCYADARDKRRREARERAERYHQSLVMAGMECSDGEDGAA